MKKVEHYICDVCGTEYAEMAKCEKCEKLHRHPVKITKARYIPFTQDATGFPVTIEVEFKDGKSTRTVTYKR